jgi:hypothetical protein
MGPLIESLGRAVDRFERSSGFRRLLDFFCATLIYLGFYQGR